jgi:hypothetical protein
MRRRWARGVFAIAVGLTGMLFQTSCDMAFERELSVLLRPENSASLFRDTFLGSTSIGRTFVRLWNLGRI